MTEEENSSILKQVLYIMLKSLGVISLRKPIESEIDALNKNQCGRILAKFTVVLKF